MLYECEWEIYGWATGLLEFVIRMRSIRAIYIMFVFKRMCVGNRIQSWIYMSWKSCPKCLSIYLYKFKKNKIPTFRLRGYIYISLYMVCNSCCFTSGLRAFYMRFATNRPSWQTHPYPSPSLSSKHTYTDACGEATHSRAAMYQWRPRTGTIWSWKIARSVVYQLIPASTPPPPSRRWDVILNDIDSPLCVCRPSLLYGFSLIPSAVFGDNGLSRSCVFADEHIKSNERTTEPAGANGNRVWLCASAKTKSSQYPKGTFGRPGRGLERRGVWCQMQYFLLSLPKLATAGWGC